MYVGSVIMMIGTRLALGSYWGLLFVIPGVAALVLPDPRRGDAAVPGTEPAIANTRSRCATA